VIIPGTKTTISDLLLLQKSGMAEAIQHYAASGGTVLGICGGYQMLGQMIADPEGIEGHAGRYQGLNLLPIKNRDYRAENRSPASSNLEFSANGLAGKWL
jgi:adenosylcobyric acid synthase